MAHLELGGSNQHAEVSVMTGPEYEQFVRAVLAERLNLAPDQLVSTRSPGATLPGQDDLKHQIDLIYFQDNEIAEYITIIECKFRSSDLVDQPEVQNLVFVKGSVRAHKAIMVTNNGFTSGARAVAKSHRVALLIIKPEFELSQKYDDVDELFDAVRSKVRSSSGNYNMAVCQKFGPDPNDRGMDIVEQLLADPTVRDAVESLLDDAGVRDTVQRLIHDRPDIANKAMDILRGRGW